MKRIYILILVICCMTFGLQTVSAQALPGLPFTINSASGNSNLNGKLYDFSVGEMVLVETFTAPSNILTQGFLQPYMFGFLDNFDILVENNVVTPNGDGKNDFFVLQGLERYPLHKLTIFDRAGRLIFQTTNYQNNWDGRFQGQLLNEDTYYFILDPGVNTINIKRGSISIILDKK